MDYILAVLLQKRCHGMVSCNSRDGEAGGRAIQSLCGSAWLYIVDHHDGFMQLFTVICTCMINYIHQNVQRLVNEMKIVNWNKVLECDDAQFNM